MSFDKADMSHKLASYQLWSQDSTTAAMGGFMGNEDPKAPRMMSEGSVSKTAASQLGELTQAKNKLKQEIAKLPEAGDEAKDGANKGQEKKEAAKAEKKEEGKKEEAKKEEAPQLGESATEEDP